MVTCTAVICSIVKYEDISKPYCVRSLLDFITDFTGRIRSVHLYAVNEKMLAFKAEGPCTV